MKLFKKCPAVMPSAAEASRVRNAIQSYEKG